MFFQKTHSSRRYTRGLNLIEAAIVLGIVGLILGCIWVVAGQVFLNSEVRSTSQQLITIAENTRAIFVEQGGVTGNSGSNINQALDQLKVFPVDMRKNDNPTGVIYNKWDGIVQVAADDCTGVEASATAQPCFGITFYDIPQSACIGLLTQTGQPGMGLQRIMVNNIVAGDANNAPLLPIKPSTIQVDCNSNRNTILWIYLLKDNNS